MTAQLELGELITTDQERDAVHIAVAPVIADGNLTPGQDVGFTEEGDSETVGISKNPIGIVDPFLFAPVKTGQRFWLFLYPNTITSLRHNWSHPAFKKQEAEDTTDVKEEKRISTSEQYIRNLADNVGLSYSALLSAADTWIQWGDYKVGGSEMEGMGVPDEFWDHYETIAGEPVEESKKSNFFSCSC